MLLLSCNQFANLLDQLVLGTLGVAVVLVHDLAVAIANEHVGDHLDAQCALELRVGVDQHVVSPTVLINERLHLVDVLALVDANGVDFDTGLIHPVLIHLVDGVELAVAGLAPCGEEIDDERLTIVGKRVGFTALPLMSFSMTEGSCALAVVANAESSTNREKITFFIMKLFFSYFECKNR